MKPLIDWLDSRTGLRALLHHLLDEPLPPGTGWSFTTGAVLTFLLGVQLLTGIGLAMYYVPSPALAYDSVAYIMHGLPLGWLLRGLHYWGATFIVLSAVVHMARVFLFGSYKPPREITWMVGVLLFLIILGFALTGYLLPWDQKAYWATTVTINIAASTPVVGEWLAGLLRGGSELGALTLGRWHTVHVIVLPALLLGFVVAHLALMRAHGISGPVRPRNGTPIPFYPWHVMKDTVMIAAVLAVLVTVALMVPAHLDPVANAADTSYIPRPEWYFLSLFQLLKYFPGPLEPLATMVVPGLAVGFLLFLPFLDRGGDRHPLGRGRRVAVSGMAMLALGVTGLTILGLRDAPPAAASGWDMQAVAGSVIVERRGEACARCHVAGGPAAELAATRVTRDDEWLLSHMADPEVIAPGARGEGRPAPPPMMPAHEARAVVAFLRQQASGSEAPPLSEAERQAIGILGTACVGCHVIDGRGGAVGPDLTTVGARRDAASIRRIIVDPIDEFGDSVMPPYGKRLKPEQIDAIAAYLAARR